MKLALKEKLDLILSSLLVLCFATAILFFIVKKHFLGGQFEYIHWIWNFTGAWVIGVAFLVLSSAVIWTNVKLRFTEPRNYIKEHGSTKGFQGSSAIPVVGSILSLIAAVFFPPSLWLGVGVIMLIMLDSALTFIPIVVTLTESDDC